MHRRNFIGGLIAMGISPSLLAKSPETRDLFFSAQGAQQQNYGFAAYPNNLPAGDNTGFRGHGASQNPIEKHRVVLFARRPGTEGVEVDVRSGKILRRFQAQPKRHFFGHGTFSGDGKKLYTTESNLETNQGVIGVRDATTFEWLTEFDSHGIGPHDIHLMPDQTTLVIANGGILTRPESGRKKLNLKTMSPSLAYINAQTGKLIEQVSISEKKASIRHLAVAKDGTVAIAMQLQREAMNHQHPVPLAAIHRQGQAITPLDAPDNLWFALQDYLGSVAISEQHGTVGFTSPHGNLAAFWTLGSSQKAPSFKGYYALNDVCGLTTSQDDDAFILSNSFGALRYLNAKTLNEEIQKRQKLNIAWDNHLFKLEPYQG